MDYFVPRQRSNAAGGALNGPSEALFIFAAAWVSAALLTWFLYSATKGPHLESTVTVEAAAHDMPAGTLLRKSDLKTVTLLAREVPKTAIREEKLALNRPLLFPVTANEPISWEQDRRCQRA